MYRAVAGEIKGIQFLIKVQTLAGSNKKLNVVIYPNLFKLQGEKNVSRQHASRRDWGSGPALAWAPGTGLCGQDVAQSACPPGTKGWQEQGLSPVTRSCQGAPGYASVPTVPISVR